MTIKEKRIWLERENRKYTATLEEIPKEAWPSPMPARLKYVYRSNQYLAQVFEECCGFRVTVSRARIKPGTDQWDDAISWDELQHIKREIGYGDFYAIEIYPRDKDIVNVANMRHLWVLAEPLNIGWFAGEQVWEPTMTCAVIGESDL